MSVFCRATPRRHPLAASLAAALASSLALDVSSAIAPAHAANAAYDRIAVVRAAAARAAGTTVPLQRPSRPTGTPNAISVSNCDDHGAGSLRDAIANASETDVIDLTHLSCSRITLTTGALTSHQGRVSLVGPGAALLTIDGSGSDRVLMHTGQFGVKLSGLSVTGGATGGKGGCVYSASSVDVYDASISSCSAGGRGGAVYATNTFFMFHGTLASSTSLATGAAGGGAYVKDGFTGIVQSVLVANSAPNGSGGALFTRDDTYVTRSTLAGNHALDGGGLYVFGASTTGVTIAGSTLSGNGATRGGGVFSTIALRINDDTIAFNAADASGGGIYASAAMTMQNTIVADNTQAGIAGDIAGNGATISGANNLVLASSVNLPVDTLRGDPLLGPLADHGGFTLTHALLSGSIATDSGNNASFLRYDQRYAGSARIIGTRADIGAYEAQTGGATIVVDNCDDDGSGSLRDAIAGAHSGDTIDLTALGCSNITLDSGALEIQVGTLTVRGPGAGALSIDGAEHGRVIEYVAYGTLSVSGVTLRHGITPVNYGLGGCILSDATLDLRDAVIESCIAQSDFNSIGGGIYVRPVRQVRRVGDAARMTIARESVSILRARRVGLVAGAPATRNGMPP